MSVSQINSSQSIGNIDRINEYNKGIGNNFNKKFVKIVDMSQTQILKITESLGLGGSKHAWKLENGQALIVPNTALENLAKTDLKNWSRIVKEEVEMSKFLTQVDILNPRSEQVSLSFIYDGKECTIPAYTSQSFQTLAEQENLFVVDCKNHKSSTWRGQDLFASKQERVDLKNWDALVMPLVEDMKKIVKYDIPNNSDSSNYAIQKTTEGYSVRYFGFDFSSKHSPLRIPTLSQKDSGMATGCFCRIVDSVVNYEFHLWGDEDTNPDFNYSEARKYADEIDETLVQKYRPVF